MAEDYSDNFDFGGMGGDWWDKLTQGRGTLGTQQGGTEGGQQPSGEFDWGEFDWENFDYSGMLKNIEGDLSSSWDNLAGQLTVQQDRSGAGETVDAESLGYHWNAVKGMWERQEGGRDFTRSQKDMDSLIQAERNRRGLPGEAMGEALELYQGDVNRLIEAEKMNWGTKLKMILGSIGASFGAALGIAEQGRNTADELRSQAEALGLESEDQINKITGFIDDRMAEVDALGQEAIQTSLNAEAEWAKSLASYKSTSAQTMSAMAIGIRRSAAPIQSAIATGMHADGTPMTAQERQAMQVALDYEVGTKVHSAIVPLASEREQTLLQGAQYASQLSQATAGVQQKQAAIQAEEGARMAGIMLQAQEQQRMYSQMSTGLIMAAETALSQSQLQASQLAISGLQNAAQLYEDFNPMSFLSGFLNLLAVPREVWKRDLGFDMEVT